jgi:hypothetical protein
MPVLTRDTMSIIKDPLLEIEYIPVPQSRWPWSRSSSIHRRSFALKTPGQIFVTLLHVLERIGVPAPQSKMRCCRELCAPRRFSCFFSLLCDVGWSSVDARHASRRSRLASFNSRTISIEIHTCKTLVRRPKGFPHIYVSRAMRAWRAATQGARHAKPFNTRAFAFTASRQHHETVADVLEIDEPVDQLEVKGWVRSVRKQKRVGFAAVSDGSTSGHVQAVLTPEDATK